MAMLDTALNTALTIILSALLGGAITYVVGVAKLKKRVEDLEKWRCFIQQDNDDGAEERRITLRSLLACLYGLQEQGCNGPVSNGIEELEDFIDRQSHKPRSYTKPSKS